MSSPMHASSPGTSKENSPPQAAKHLTGLASSVRLSATSPLLMLTQHPVMNFAKASSSLPSKEARDLAAVKQSPPVQAPTCPAATGFGPLQQLPQTAAASAKMQPQSYHQQQCDLSRGPQSFHQPSHATNINAQPSLYGAFAQGPGAGGLPGPPSVPSPEFPLDIKPGVYNAVPRAWPLASPSAAATTGLQDSKEPPKDPFIHEAKPQPQAPAVLSRPWNPRHNAVKKLHDTQDRLLSCVIPEEATVPGSFLDPEAPLVTGDGEDVEEDGEEGETFADYRPTKVRLGGPHPDAVVETASLSAVEPPNPTFRLQIAGDRPPTQLTLPSELQGLPAANLSCLQLEAVTYACQRHETMLPEGVRAGFMIGDGAGMGKGRTVAAIIKENWLRGRTRHIWISINQDLKEDAKRDLNDLGGPKIDVQLLTDVKNGRSVEQFGFTEGVLFLPYTTLISGSAAKNSTRLEQIIEWCRGTEFSGVIILDECHKAKNLIPDGRIAGKSTKTGAAVLELQRGLPNGRVVYCSATGATEAWHLGYMARLGLWGIGTQFKTFGELQAAIKERGIAVLELLAMDMKARGMYLCRTLSYKGACFEVDQVPLEGGMERMYNEAARFWTELKHDIQDALDRGHGKIPIANGKLRTPPVWGNFWAAHLRFFSIMCMAAKVPATVRLARSALAQGKCVVIGLQSTGEARTEDAASRNRGVLDDWVSGPKEVLLKLVKDFYPLPDEPVGAVWGDESDPEPSACSDNDEDGLLDGLSDSMRERIRVAQLLSSAPAVSAHQRQPAVAVAPLEAKAVYAGAEPCLVCNRGDAEPQGRLLQCVCCKHIAHKGCFQRRSPSQKICAQSIAKMGPNCVSASWQCEVCEAEEAEKGSRNAIHDGDRACEVCRSASKFRSKDDFLQECTECHSVAHTLCFQARGAGPSPTSGKAGHKAEPASGWACAACRPRKRVASSNAVPESKGSAACASSAVGSNTLKFPPVADSAAPRRAYLSAGEREYAEAVARKKSILAVIEGLALPNNPLDELVDQLGGPDAVAEMTGRKVQVVSERQGGAEGGGGGKKTGVKLQSRKVSVGDTGDNVNLKEKSSFMDGEKLVAIISDAASAGISLQADRRARNQRRRMHITMELPWSADKAIQQFGRSHRSNQTSAPEYHLLMTELGGEKRFASVVASRLESLGTITQGDRRAGAFSLRDFNYSGPYGKRAVEAMYKNIRGEELTPVAPPSCEPLPAGTSLSVSTPAPWKAFFASARAAMILSGVFKDDEEGDGLQRVGFRGLRGGEDDDDVICGPTKDTASRDVRLFLNRMLGLKPGVQRALFHYFCSLYAHVLKKAQESGDWDKGIRVLRAATQAGPPEVVFLDSASGAQTVLYCFSSDRGLTFEEAKQKLVEEKCIRVAAEAAQASAFPGSAAGSPLGAAAFPKPRAKKTPLDGFYISINPVQGHHLPLLVLERGAPFGYAAVCRPYDKGLKRMPLAELKAKYKRDRTADGKHTKPLWVTQYNTRSRECMHGKECECSSGRRFMRHHILSGSIFPVWGALDKAHRVQDNFRYRRFSVVHVEKVLDTGLGGAAGAGNGPLLGLPGLQQQQQPPPGLVPGQAALPASSIIGVNIRSYTALALKQEIESMKSRAQGRSAAPTTAHGAQAGPAYATAAAAAAAMAGDDYYQCPAPPPSARKRPRAESAGGRGSRRGPGSRGGRQSKSKKKGKRAKRQRYYLVVGEEC